MADQETEFPIEGILRKWFKMYDWSKAEERAINDFILTVCGGVQEDLDAASVPIPVLPEDAHGRLCELLGISSTHPRPDWLPYAVQATKVEIHTEHGRQKWGGGMRCGGCGFGVDIQPGPGTQHPEPEALARCPKCGYGGLTE